MLTHTRPISNPSIQALGHRIGKSFRNALREKEAVHIFKRENKIYTFDIPFSLKTSENGDDIFVVIDKENLPRRYSSQSLIEAKDWIEKSIGMPIQILDRQDVIAICCHIPNNEIYPIAV